MAWAIDLEGIAWFICDVGGASINSFDVSAPWNGTALMGMLTNLTSFSPYNGLCFDYETGLMYLAYTTSGYVGTGNYPVSSCGLYEIDMANGTATLSGSITHYLTSPNEYLLPPYALCCIFIPYEPNVTLMGDVDGDGELSVSDALLLLRYSMGIYELTEQGMLLADYNEDGYVDANDALLILRYVLLGS